MSDTKHTPTPWAVGEYHETMASVFCEATEGGVMICRSHYPIGANLHNDIDFMLLAVNSHAALLAACELAVKNTERAMGDPIMFLPIRIAALAAIAQAKAVQS